MALTVDQLVRIRRQVGDKPDNAALQSIYDRTGDLDELVLEVLEIRLANLVASPAQFTVVGEYGQDTGKNIDALKGVVGVLGGGNSRVRIVEPASKPPR